MFPQETMGAIYRSKRKKLKILMSAPKFRWFRDAEHSRFETQVIINLNYLNLVKP